MKFHLFAWPSRHNIHIALPLFIVLALVLHIAGFMVFRVAYPRSHGSPERSAEVYFLQPGSQAAIRLAPILAASDPALFSPGELSERGAWTLPESPYVANFDIDRPSLDQMPAGSLSSSLPPTITPGPVALPREKTSSKTTRAPGLPTAIRLEGSLQDRSITPPSEAKFASTLTREMTPTSFLVAVSPDGLPLHIFPMHILSRSASGHEILDQDALRYLAGSRFSPAPNTTEPAWGTVVFQWGDDVEKIKNP